MTESLKWTAQLRVGLGKQHRLKGDKIALPQSALEALLAAAPVVSVEDQHGSHYTSSFDPFNHHSFAAEQRARQAYSNHQQQLPHPLTFKLVNSANGRTIYAGIRDFSTVEGEIELSDFLVEALGLQSKTTPPQNSRDGTPNADAAIPDAVDQASFKVTAHAHQLPKGTYVRLRPLEAGYDDEDWKSLLERYLRDNFTTLTNGEILDVPGVHNNHFKFLVDKFEPQGDGICVVDTDLEVDIEALNEEQARETLNRRLAKAKRMPGTAQGSSVGGVITTNSQVTGHVLPGEYVDYEVRDWPRNQTLFARLDGDDTVLLDILVSPFSSRQRARPRLDEHIFSDISCEPSKAVKISHKHVEVEVADSIFISVHCSPVGTSSQALQYTLQVLSTNDESIAINDTETAGPGPGPDEVKCKNCLQAIPKRTLPLHEAFCYRNNVVCPKCHVVFLKASDSWQNHWHCDHDDDHGDSEETRTKHNQIFHPAETIRCPACDYEAFNFPILAQHRTSVCPAKEILCRFCHLVVPQQGPEDPALTDAEVILSGLTPHELTDGSRTTECHLCGKIVKLQSMEMHLKLHDRDRVLRPKPKICINAICGRTIKHGKEAQSDKEQLSLCDECFGPLYGTTFDPEGKALRRRVERRLLQQLMGGCGRSWCHNSDWCKRGRLNATGADVIISTKDALLLVRPVLDQLTKGDHTGLRFCVDEASQSRRAMAELLSAEGAYELEWTIKALEESRNDIDKARVWLKDMAPKKDEILA